MISPSQIMDKALNKYPTFLREHFAGRSIFPYQIPIGIPKGTDDLGRVARESRALIDGSVEAIGYGYSVESEIVGTRVGDRRTPKRVFFQDEVNYLRFIVRDQEVASIGYEIRLIASFVPQAESWARLYPQRVLAKIGKWGAICTIINYLITHPRPGCFPRELPINVSGKLLAEESQTICEVLASIPGPHWQEGGDFYDQLGLRRPPRSFIRMRMLSPESQTAIGSPHGEIAISLDELVRTPLPVKRVFVTENLMTYLAFPMVNDAIVIWGEGRAAERLPEITWLASKELFYWGDIDPHGMDILRALRRLFPELRSLLMDKKTLDAYQDLAIDGKRTPSLSIDGLHCGERDAAIAVWGSGVGATLCLEQEKIPQSELTLALRSIAIDSPPVT